MSQVLRLMGRVYHTSFPNSFEAPCMACVSLRTGYRAYSSNPLTRTNLQQGKRKKKWKKKPATDLECKAQEQFKLTEVLSKHIKSLQASGSVASDSYKEREEQFRTISDNYTFKQRTKTDSDNQDSYDQVQYKPDSNYVHSASVKRDPQNVLEASQSAHSKNAGKDNRTRQRQFAWKDPSLQTVEKETKTQKTRKRRETAALERARNPSPQTSFQTTHFDQQSREKAKQIFAYKGSISDVKVIPLPTQTKVNSQEPNENTSSESGSVFAASADQCEVLADYVYDESEWENIKDMRRKKEVRNLLTLSQTRALEMARDRHLEKLDEPSGLEENGPNAFAIDLNDSFSVEGVITKKAKEKQGKLKQQQQRLEMKKLLRAKNSAKEKQGKLKQQQQRLEMKKLLRAKNSSETLDQLHKDERTRMFNEQLKCYVDVCVAAGLLDRAISDLRFYRREFRKARILTPIRDVNVYNIVLRGLAKLSDEKASALERTRDVFSWIREDDLKPNMESYCLCLASLGVTSDYDLMMASFIVKDMRTNGFDVQDVYNQCTFLHNERNKLNKIFRLLIPDFKPNPPRTDIKYEGPLVENLNQPIPVSEMTQQNSLAGAMTAEKILQQTETQFSREIDGYVKVESVFPQTKLSDLYEQKIAETVEHWRKSIKEGLIRRRNWAKKQAFSDQGMNLYPFLCLFPLDDYVDILTMEAQSLALKSQHYSPNISGISDMADHIHARYMTHSLHNTGVFHKLQKIYAEYVKTLMNPNLACHNQRVTWRKIQRKFKDGNSIELPNKQWPRKIMYMVGRELMDVVLSATTVNINMFSSNRDIPEKYMQAFLQVNRMRDDRVSREFMPHPVLVKLMNPTTEMTFPTKTLPMLCPPVPYLSSTYGGNFVNTVTTVRSCSAEQDRKFAEMSPHAGPVFDALNILGACAWQINKPVLDVAIKVFRDGGDMNIDIPVLPAKLEVPVKPIGEPDQQELREYYRQKKQYVKTYGEATSLWWTMLYKLSIANMYKNETFWFPMNMDFRGRTYTVAPHLNHQGDDVNRGIIQFAKAKPLGEEGFKWLKIHLVNLTGLRKRSSNVDRLKFCDDLMPSILDSADNPLTGDCWWRESEEPWQSLAACMEITKAVRSGSPAQFVSHLPVHQDGSCNGLQHYAALGRDELGAKSVNLHPLEVPSDVYTEVLELVKKEIERDIEMNTENAHLAKISQDYIERKVIKQSVMTTVYGVTVYGARHQIARQLKYKNLNEKHMLDVSMYLTRKTFDSLNEMFTSAKNIQDWFNACATLLASLDLPMEWVTPLNFPILQPYYKSLGDDKHLNHAEDNLKKVDGRKQVNAFAPNFIHSLDATHMMLTALDCHRRGITFISVHDCFWTHPAYVGIMNKVTREQFVSLYRQPVLQNLSLFLLSKCAERAAENSDVAREMENIQKVLTAVPGTGNFELENVLESTYFFS